MELVHRARLGARAAQFGFLANALLAVVKLLAGLVGHSYALVADAIESFADVLSSLVVWGGLRLAVREADADHPFGHGKAEPLAAAFVGLMLLGASAAIAVQAIEEIVTPHDVPAPFTLWVLVGVVVVKEVLFRRVFAVGEEVASHAVRADAWHHRSDAITSAAAAVGISVALLGGERWAAADDWAALFAAAIIAWNGVRVARPAIDDLMDRAPDREVLEVIEATARAVPGVLATEKLRVRRAGLGLLVDLHVQADPRLSLHAAHILGGRVKTAIRRTVPLVAGVLVHMEPFEPAERSPVTDVAGSPG